MNRSTLLNLLLAAACGSAVCCSELVASSAHAGGLGGRRAGGAHIGGGVNRANFGGGGMPNVSRPNLSAMPSRPSAPQMPISRPQTSVPHLGGSSLPASNLQKPAVTRPASRPTTLPQNGMPNFSKLPAGRASASDLGNYLGMDRPLRPETKPALPERPSALPERPSIDRPSLTNPNVTNPNVTRPNVMRPSNERPPVNIGQINLGNNTNISTRPSWVNINQNQISQINQKWQGQLGNLANWPTTYPARIDDYHRWGNDLRRNWVIDPGYCRPAWWNNHPFHCSGWHYFHVYWRYPYSYWWTTPSYNQVAQWLAWSTLAGQSQPPVYYDYSSGGNVTYEDNRVSIAGQPVASSDEFAASAAALATVEAPASDKEVEQAEWLPLGTFALTTSKDDVDANKIVQLAINKDGIVSGTLHDQTADTVVALQGRVDKETQRVAVRVGDSDRVVAETGLYDLTQDEASVLVHFGDITQDSCLLVRLADPEAKPTGSPTK